MKRILTPALACLLLASLWGCSSSPDAAGQEGTYHVYYSALEDQRAPAALGYESYELPQDASPVLALLRRPESDLSLPQRSAPAELGP